MRLKEERGKKKKANAGNLWDADVDQGAGRSSHCTKA